MPRPKETPSLGDDLAALADLYVTFLWMLRQRLHYGARWQDRYLRRVASPFAVSQDAPEHEPVRSARR